jgi:hypothetical protein
MVRRTTESGLRPQNEGPWERAVVRAHSFRHRALRCGERTLPAETDPFDGIVNSESQPLAMKTNASSQSSFGDDPWNLQQSVDDKN